MALLNNLYAILIKSFCTLSKVQKLLLILLSVQSVYAQELSFKLSHDNVIQEEFYLKAFKNKGYQLYKSEDSVMTVDISVLKKADSVMLFYSFYNEFFDFNRLNSGIYKVAGKFTLDTVILDNKATRVLELRGAKNSIIGANFMASSIERNRINGKTLRGIELRFEKTGQMRYKGEKLKFSNMEKKFSLIVALSNQRDSIYPSKLPHVTYEFSVAKSGWNYFQLDGFDFNLDDYKFIVVILIPEPGSNMGPGVKWLRKKEKGILKLNRRFLNDTREMYFVKARYLNGEEITDFTLDFKLHYLE